VRVELDLAGHVDDDEVFFGERIECFGKEVEVLEQELKTVDESAVGPEPHFFHHIFERYEVFDVEVGFVGEVFGGGVEVDVEAGAAVGLEVIDEGGAEGGLGRGEGLVL
jgi:hypothetical protein